MTCIRCHEREARGLVCDSCLAEPQRATSYSQIGSSGATAPKRPERAPDGLAPTLAPDRGATGHLRPAVRRIVLPWRVIVRDNERHGLMGGRILLTRRYRAALEEAREIVRLHCAGEPPLVGDAHLRVDMFPPDRRRRDLLNYAKLICDALSGSAIEDDHQIARTEWVRQHVDKAHPRVEVEVRAMSSVDSAA